MALANYSTRHWLMTVSGDLFGAQVTGAQEHWSMGIRLAGASTQVAPTQGNVDAMITSTSAWMGSTSNGFANPHKLTKIKLAPIATTGLYPAGEVAVETAPLSVPGTGNTAPSWPAQCSMAMSLTTGVARGRAHIGRVYLPPNQALGLDANGSVVDSQITNMLTAFRTWMNAIIALNADASPFVMSRFGDQHKVTGLRLGQIPDTQRRRRRSLSELPVSMAL